MRFLYTKDGMVYAECDICKKILRFKEQDLNQIQEGVECFCGNVSGQITGLPNNDNTQVKTVQQITYTQKVGIHCPTCGSEDVQKISLASKAVGGYMFGIFSSNIRNTFKCNSCGYKW